ncbi:MAG: recombination protein RecR [candidate division Zixibacteria bacterium RBG_16_53_22]|nr:MAG: recombination protein RecR [candidate division Zixibacteria bacterium RBG_16_53_22]
MPKALDHLIEALASLPGIGRKSAARLAFHILKRPPQEAADLAARIVAAREKLRPCNNCGNLAEADLCDICANPARDNSIICVVEESSDVAAIEATNDYRGFYHVLGGALSPLDGVGPEELNLDSLSGRVSPGAVREVIIATNPSTEGEATASYIITLLRDSGVKMSRIARGLPAGGSLEFADRTTLARALENRTTLK